METDKNSLLTKAYAYERVNGSVAFLKECASALNHVLVNKGLVTVEELTEAVSDQLDASNTKSGGVSISEDLVDGLKSEAVKTDILGTEGPKLTDDEAKRIQTALNRYEKILRGSCANTFASLRCAMLEESVRVAEELQLIPRSENQERKSRKDIWRVRQNCWNEAYSKGGAIQLLVEAESAAEAAILAGEDSLHETIGIENFGPVTARKIT